jgi:starvation-inducible DNA-binding protein
MTAPIHSAALPATALDAGRRGEIFSDLNSHLANLIDVALSAKQAHWNVRGPNFQGLHELFDVIATEVRTYSDEVAERVVTLGGTAHGTVQDAALGSRFSPFATDERDWEALVIAVEDRLIGAAEALRKSANTMEDDQATQDLYIEIIRGVEKRAWMLDAHRDRGA